MLSRLHEISSRGLTRGVAGIVLALSLAIPGPAAAAAATKIPVILTTDIQVTDDGFTVIDPAAKKMSVAMSWKDLGAFEDLLVERLTGVKQPSPISPEAK